MTIAAPAGPGWGSIEKQWSRMTYCSLVTGWGTHRVSAPPVCTNSCCAVHAPAAADHLRIVLGMA